MSFNTRYENSINQFNLIIPSRYCGSGSGIRVFRPDPDPNLSKYLDPTGSGSETLDFTTYFSRKDKFEAFGQNMNVI